jgi:NAD(P)H-quinone oxidoreductase subunit 4L
MTIGLNHYLVLSAIVFTIGLYGALGKRNAVVILMSIELMFNAVNVAFVAVSRFLPATPGMPLNMGGQVFALFVITVAAAEAAVALAIILAIYRTRKTVSIDDLNLLKW